MSYCYAPAGVAYPLRCAIRSCSSEVLGEMRKDCDEGCVMERREVRAEARGMSCLNMTAGLPEDTERKMKEECGVAMGERCWGSR